MSLKQIQLVYGVASKSAPLGTVSAFYNTLHGGGEIGDMVEIYHSK